MKGVRERGDGNFSLVRTPGGFGTPRFGEGSGCQVRVEGAELVVLEDGAERRGSITTLADATELIGPRLLPPETRIQDDAIGRIDLTGRRDLRVDPETAGAIADLYAVGEAILERLVSSAGPDDAATEPTLWPEHFDLAIEMGSEGAGKRVNYGVSPGDEHHPEPYLYVGPWTARPEGELWNAVGFPGAEIGYGELAAGEDPVTVGIEFCATRKSEIDKMEVTG